MKKRSVFAAWLLARWLLVGVLLFCAGVGVLVFWLYGLPWETIAYVMSLCGAGTMFLSAVDYIRFWRKHRVLKKVQGEILVTDENLPQPETLLDEDYLDLIEALYRENRRQKAQTDQVMAEMETYYTLWVHQIKTPIAAARLLLQSGAEGRESELEVELLKIAQYVDMVLQYLRLDSHQTDLVLTRCDLDQVIRQTVRKYAKLFILNKLRLDFQETKAVVLSDEKWLAFLLEQILSNALKYTPKGGVITIAMEQGKHLVIADTGIGIAPEDLPRVFDKGFTGCNGRVDRKATGIGLYLCRRVADQLGHSLSITSQKGKGTQVCIGLQRPSLLIE